MSQTGAFLFDPRRFWGDNRVKKMTGEQIGLYLKLLSIQWEEGDLPVDTEDLACEVTEGRRIYRPEELSSGKDSLSPAKGELMHGLQECFQPLDDDPSRMRNSYMHEVRETWRALQKARSDGGRKGGKKSRKPKKTKPRQADPKPTLSPPKAHSKPTPKPNVSKGREGKITEGKRPETDSPELAADGDSRPAPFTEIIHGKICHSCPACGATPDQMCQTPNGKPRNHHKARLKLESVQGEQAPGGSTGPPGVSSKEVMPLEGPRAPDLHTDAEPPPAEPSDPAVEGRKKPNRAQEVRSLLRALENRGLKGVAELWAARLEQTNASKRPNTARQATQLRKVLKGLDDGKTLQDARKLIRMAGERGWSGIEWRYLNGDGKTTGGYKPRSRYHMGRGGEEDEKEPERNF